MAEENIKLYMEKYTPRLIFREQAYHQIKMLMHSKHAATKEFMFYCLVEKRINNTFFIDRAELMPNKSTSGAYCEADEEKLIPWMMETFTDQDRNRIRCHAHSHVNMATNPSGTDDNEIKELAKNIRNYYIQLIVNHKDENTCNIFDKETGFIYNKVKQYITVGNYIYDIKDKEICEYDETKNEIYAISDITDGTYTIKDGYLVLNENLMYNFTAGEFILTGEKLVIGGEKIVPLYNEEDEKAIEELFKARIKETPSYYNGTSYKSGTSYGGSSYGSSSKTGSSSGSSYGYGGSYGYGAHYYDDDDYPHSYLDNKSDTKTSTTSTKKELKKHKLSLKIKRTK